MGLFNFFNRQNGHLNGTEIPNPSTAQHKADIDEDLFTEKEKPGEQEKDAQQASQPAQNGINLLFQFLEKNHEMKGYDDALVNPDTTHLQQNISALKNALERTIRKVKLFYEDFIREIDFHIASRSRSGMIDTVEELTVKKQTAQSHITQVLEIEQQAKQNEGVGQGIILSYERGFRNGLAAISHHSILRKNF